METTTTKENLVSNYTTFAAMADHLEWGGWGYIGGRMFIKDFDLRTEADQIVLDHAVAQGWTDADLFEWANGRRGRHFADAAEYGDLAGARRILTGR